MFVRNDHINKNRTLVWEEYISILNTFHAAYQSVKNGVISLSFAIIQCKFMKCRRHYTFVMSFNYILKGVFI